MSDDLVKRLRNPPFGTESSERNLMASAADALDAQAAEITRLRAALTTARQDGMEAMAEKIAGWHDALVEHYSAMEREFRTIAEHLDPDAMQSAIRCAQGASQHRQRASEIRAAAKEGNQS